MQQRKKIGVLGGSFNPVHLGHLVLAQDAREAFDLDAVWLVPCLRPAHKPERALASAAHRGALLDLVVRQDPALQWSAVEFDRPRISYAVDTMQLLTDQYPEVEWSFIIGADTLAALHAWKDIEKLLNLCQFLTMQRPGHPPPEMLARSVSLPPPWPDRLRAGIFAGHGIDISASEIRKRVALKQSIRYLVPETVERYIRETGLYRTESDKECASSTRQL